MAGSYPDPPGHRIAYDRDGSTGVWTQAGVYVRDLTQAELTDLNKERSGMTSSSVWNGHEGVVLLPVPHDLSHVDGSFNNQFQTMSLAYSTDTTNGSDGTWTALANGRYSSDLGAMRSPTAVGASGVVAVRFDSGWDWDPGELYRLHLYGTPVTPYDGVEFWHPTLDQRLDPVEYGNVPRGNQADMTFRIKNMSASLTANAVVLSAEALSDASPSVADDFTFAPDGSTFTSTLDIGNLAPGAISSVVTVRKQTGVDAALGLWWPRLLADPTSWT